MIYSFVLVLTLAIGSTIARAQAPAQHQPAHAVNDRASPYAGQCVVRIRTTSQAQLDSALAIASDVWSERIGVGVLEIQIDRERLDELTRIGVPHDVLIEDLHRVVLDEQQQIQAVREAQAHTKPNGFQRGGQAHDPDWFATYRTLDEITSYFQNIEAIRPDLAQIDTIGQSWEGRDMFSITISGPDTPENPVTDRPAVFIFSTVHAREWIAPMTTSYIASKLTQQYDLDPSVQALLDGLRVVIVPVGNPDGYVHTWTDYRGWRTTRHDFGDGVFGVDINRNWGYEWGGSGSSGTPGTSTYRGTEPFSEPETRALRDVSLGLGDKLIAHIDYHSFSQLIMWPFGHEEQAYTPEPFVSVLEQIANEMRDTILDTSGTQYRPMQSFELYPAAGDSCDWHFGVLNKITYTIELRTLNSFSPPADQIFPCADENYEAFLVFAENALREHRLIHIPADTHYTNDPEPLRLHVLKALDPALDGSVTLHTRKAGDETYTATPMTLNAENEYLASIPNIACGDTIEYYFSLTIPDGEDILLPQLGWKKPYTTSVLSKAMSFRDDLETDKGWLTNPADDNATTGHWTRSDPEGTTQQPEDDHSPLGTHCWVTDGRAGTNADEFDVDGGATYLTSPRFSAIDGSVVSFWFWRSESRYRLDRADIYLSNDDGATWSFIERLPRQSRSWQRYELPIPADMTPSHDTRLQVVMRDIRADHTIELAIDDFSVGIPGCPVNDADLNADGALNFIDVSLFIEAYQAESLWADTNADDQVNFFDVAEFLRLFLDA
ncbi:MAG: hypothetical protein CMJ35_03820 [Phycisphaerae bacterium]|nr:hypothetical protein [Phycisphaerae bacterium]MBM90727.1 hypothetical protein [Phycisphaerae bacterium]